ncbi:cbb3-type cytochrome oxidase assembly protein CcoS [Nitrogeniibacter mangrovi]|uniref:Cbb3-type cytochrome oxidase assembly protein CcoS n=1 Tax=Nitrogeniibacter mangrovi TaxID=2016596 RepID=A0A6C1B0R5_9RHOO|nr:cbb3-type cytochrome oxidase assembly protein CcoS [Nitrogeniibacter mangrovi]QID17196.1 cbb3-type cytochrome oxidase assembly protein CcoS [Nitrogeniibacter mangrovi]
MESLYLLIPLSVLLVFIIGFLFWWSVRSGQFDDMEGPAYRMLMDDDDPKTGKARHAAPEGRAARRTPNRRTTGSSVARLRSDRRNSRFGR